MAAYPRENHVYSCRDAARRPDFAVDCPSGVRDPARRGIDGDYVFESGFVRRDSLPREKAGPRDD